MLNKRTLRKLVIVLIVVLTSSLFISACGKKEEPQTEPEPVEEPELEPELQPAQEPDIEPTMVDINPLTGEKLEKFSDGKRPVAIMVENSEDARPQWGMDDEKFSPDIILEGEVEYGITRTMWLFSDYNAIPSIVGPVRSARPPYVKFSELFDAIYVHWGGSTSTSDYVGADTVIFQDGVNNIDQMTFYGNTELFGRATDRNVALEHTGILYGENLGTVIDEYGFRTNFDEKQFSRFSFNDEAKPLSDTSCNKLQFLLSGRSWTKTWTYSEEDHLYHTDDYRNNVTRTNLLILLDNTEYITKSSSGVTYCNYRLDGGEGKLASEGTVIDILWSIKDGKLVIKDKDGKVVNLNPGKTWIGWGSGNNGGVITVE